MSAAGKPRPSLGGGRDGALRRDTNPACTGHQNHGQQATNRFALPRGDPMTGQQPGPGWWLASDGRWYPPEAAGRPETPPRKDNTENNSFRDLLKTIQEVLKTIGALKAVIWGGGATVAIVVVIVISHHPTPVSPPNNTYPLAAQQSWMSSCETVNNNTEEICGCEWTYFEQHVSYPQFEQDYSETLPGVVPAQLANAEACTA